MIIINKIQLLNNDDKWIVFANKGVRWIYFRKSDDFDEFGQKETGFYLTDVSDISYESDLIINNLKYKEEILNKNVRPDYRKRIEIKDDGLISVMKIK